jgi:glycosyltransferase involved in cell wall biosynthesis
MKILFVSQYFYPETFRGNDIVFDFVKKGHDVTVLTGKPNYPLGTFYEGYKFWGVRKEIINGANVIRVPTFPRGKSSVIKLILNYFSFFLFSYPYSRFKTDKDFDIIFVQQLSPVTMAMPGIWALKRNKKAKLYLWVLDLWPESVTATTGITNKFIISLLDNLVKYVYSKSDSILISSKSFENSIKQRSINKQILYFPNWAESIYEKTELNKDYKLPLLPNGFNIMFAGNIGEAQDFETILSAAIQTKAENINWILVGDGRKLDWVRSQVKLHNLQNVAILGRFPIEAMPYFFKEANVMLLTLKNSTISDLTVPAKLQAYAASGKIILAAINGEAYNIINSHNIGLACKSGDFKTLSENAKIIKNISDEQKILMEQNSKNLYYSSYSKKVLLDKLENIFKSNCNIE